MERIQAEIYKIGIQFRLSWNTPPHAEFEKAIVYQVNYVEIRMSLNFNNVE